MSMKFVYSIVFSCFILLACGQNKDIPAQAGNNVPARKSSIVQKLKEFDHKPIKERIALYYQFKKENPQAYTFDNEDELTMYGYAALWANKVTEAIEIFKLIVAEFPSSSNSYDSLGEAYLANGDNEQSLANYAKSLELNPDNFNAEDQIERIKNPNKVPEKPAEKFAKKFTIDQYKADLDQLGHTLIRVHPNALKFITREDFWKIVEEKKALITEYTTYGQFAWHCNEIIANVHCSHTSMGGFNLENVMLPLSLRFPLQTRLVNSQLFVIDPLNNDGKVNVKDEILSVNGIAVVQLIADIYKHIPSQGYIQTTKNHFFNTWSTGLIPYTLGFPETYTIVIKGSEHPIVLNKAETFKNLLNDPSVKKCGSNLCFEVVNNSNQTAILTISSFNYYPWGDLPVFKHFIDSIFNKIAEGQIKNLIIDLRFNGGGSQHSSIHLLRYLMDKPFLYYSNAQFKGKTEKIEGEDITVPFENRYKGKLYFLIDGQGNSTTGHFMSLVKVFNLGIIIGEELGSNQFCSAGQTICRLSHTKLEYYVADNTHESTATSLPDEKGIMPDYYVMQSIEEYLNHKDTVKEFAIKLIEKSMDVKRK